MVDDGVRLNNDAVDALRHTRETPASTSLEHRRRSSGTRRDEVDVVARPAPPCATRALEVGPPYRSNCRRIGALKAVDRLLGIADREQSAPDLARAVPGEELVGQGADDPPLIGVGVLCLVDQDVVQPAIELVQDPGRDRRPAHQRRGVQNEIVVVESAWRRLMPS